VAFSFPLPTGSTLLLESRYTPPVKINLSAAGPEPQSLIVRLLKPRVTIALAGTSVATVAPAGDPEPNEWPKVRIGLLVAGGLAVIGLLKLFR
jgi:hypothetical protein